MFYESIILVEYLLLYRLIALLYFYGSTSSFLSYFMCVCVCVTWHVSPVIPKKTKKQAYSAQIAYVYFRMYGIPAWSILYLYLTHNAMHSIISSVLECDFHIFLDYSLYWATKSYVFCKIKTAK